MPFCSADRFTRQKGLAVAILNTVAQLGKYRLRTRLATSKACEVWLAEIDGEKSGSPPVILKKLRRELAAQTHLIDRFFEQAKAAQELRHDNIGSVLDVVRDLNDCGYVCEHLDGKTLRQLIGAVKDAGNALPVWFAIHVARCICQALEYAHEPSNGTDRSHQVFHQNLCPENVFLTYRGQIKVTDFGLSHTVLARNDKYVVTPSTVCPAQSENPTSAIGPKDPVREDLDGVGRVLYELLTGMSPNTVEGSPVDFIPPSHHAPWVNAEVDQILRRILSPSYPQRVKTAAELRQVLIEYLTQRRHDVSATHIAGLVTVLFSGEIRDTSPSTIRFDDGAVQMAQMRSRRTSPPEGSFRTSFEHNAPTRPGLSMPAPSQSIRPTLPSPAEATAAAPLSEMEVTPFSSPDLDSQLESAESKPNPFHHDWDLALKRAREQTQLTARSSGTYATPKVAPPPPPIDPAEQAVIEFEKGLELRLRGELDAALAAWEKALELDPQHRVCRANLNLLKKKLNIS